MTDDVPVVSVTLANSAYWAEIPRVHVIASDSQTKTLCGAALDVRDVRRVGPTAQLETQLLCRECIIIALSTPGTKIQPDPRGP